MSSVEALSETAACPKCGVDVRPGSVFCYNCGDPVVSAEEIDDLKLHSSAAVVDAEESIKRPAPGMRSAADLKARHQLYRHRPRKIEWEPVAETADRNFILITALIALFTFAVIFLAFYFR
jgi:hypothetical protein